MESKVLQGEAQGGLSVLARRQEEVLRSQQQLLQRQRSKDAAKLRQIADLEEAALMAQDKYSSLQASTHQYKLLLTSRLTHCWTYSLADSLARSFTPSLTLTLMLVNFHSLARSLTHSVTYPHAHSLTHSLACSLPQSLSPCFDCSSTGTAAHIRLSAG